MPYHRRMYTLYQYDISPFCDKVRRVLNFKGIGYKVREVTLAETARGFLNKLGGQPKLPVLENGSERIFDSTDICTYLEERHPDPAVYPTAPADRGLALMLEDWADESLYFYEMYLRFTLPHNAKRWMPVLCEHDGRLMSGLANRIVPRALKKKVASQGVGKKPHEHVVRDVTRHVSAVDERLAGGDWLVGDALSIADIAVFAQLSCIAGTREGEELIAGRSRVGPWLERVDSATSR